MSQTSPLRGFGALIGKYTKSQKSEEEKPEEMDCADRTEREVPEEDITTDSLIRQNLHPEIVKFLNKQVNLELQAWYTYLSMGIYFKRHDVALPGFAKFFMDSAKEERGHARRFERYINKRGGSVVLQDIPKPSADSWGTGLRAIRIALDMEKSLNEVLLKLHQLAIKHKDPSVERFVKKFICEQVVMIKKLGDYETNLKRVGEKLGVYMFDKKTLNSEVVTKHGDKVDSVSDSSDSDSDN